MVIFTELQQRDILLSVTSLLTWINFLTVRYSDSILIFVPVSCKVLIFKYTNILFLQNFH